MKSTSKFIVLLVTLSVLTYWFSWWLWAPNILSEPPLFRLSKTPSISRSAEQSEQLKQRVNQLWDRIETQLKQIAPRDLESLAEGCSIEELAELESRLGFELPVEVQQSLLRHNGSSGREVGGMCRLYSIQDIRDEFDDIRMESWCEAEPFKWEPYSDVWPTGVRIAIWADFYLQVESTNAKMYIYRAGHHSSDFLTSDWSTVLEAWAVALEEGKYRQGEQGTYILGGLFPY